MDENYFNLLGLPIDATPEEIRASYYKSARLYHPDKNPSAEASIHFQHIQEAFETLSDNPRRVEY